MSMLQNPATGKKKGQNIRKIKKGLVFDVETWSPIISTFKIHSTESI